MKKCFKCGEEKPLLEFYKHAKMADGHLGKCKECTKQDSEKRFKQKLDDPVWAIAERKRQREKENRRRCAGMVKKSTGPKKDCRKPANHILGNAIRDGKIIQKPCEVCGKARSQGHHEDYSPSKELDVQWLCSRHHNDRHIHLRDRKTLRQNPIEINEWISEMKSVSIIPK